MKCSVVLTVVFLCSICSGSQFIGAPVPNVQEGKFAIFGLHDQSDATFVLDNMDLDVETSTTLAGVEYGIVDWLSVKVGLGIANLDSDRIDGDNEFAYHVSLQGAWEWRPNLYIGVVGLASGFTADARENERLSFNEGQIAVALELKHENWNVYAGPFFTIMQSTLECETGHFNREGERITEDFDLKSKDDFGIYVGGTLKIWDSLIFNPEYRHKENDQSWTLCLTKQF